MLRSTVETIVDEFDELDPPEVRSPRIPRLLDAPGPDSGAEPPGPSTAVLPGSESALSGGRVAPGDVNDGLPRYLRVLKGLVRDGGWLGTTNDLARMTGDDPETVFASLLRYRPNLNQNNIVVATVEVEDGWRWLAVDRGRLAASRPPSVRWRA